MIKEIMKEADRLAPSIIELRRKLHRYPESGFAEEKTAEILRKFLEEHGFKPTAAAKTGLTARWESQDKGKTVALRADMDAIPVEEKTGLPYASLHTGMMHACGHDAHMAMLTGAAAIIQNLSPNLKGAVLFIFQPSEEKPPGGAQEIISENILRRNNVDAAFALHVYPFLPTGQVAVRPGKFMAAGDRFTIDIIGQGGHGALPHKAIDPIYIAGNVIQSLQNIVGRQVDPLDTAVISIGQIQGGNEFNIIPSHVKLMGTVRTLSKTLHQEIKKRMEDLVRGITAAYGAQYEFTYEAGYPLLENDVAMTELVRDCAYKLDLGPSPITLEKPSTGSEDFAYFLQEVPGSYFFLGVGEENKNAYPLHSPFFQLDENVLRLGAALLAYIAMRYLRDH